MATSNGEARSVPVMWMLASMLTVLLMVVGLYTASVNQRIDAATIAAANIRAIVDGDAQRITRLEAQYDAIGRTLERIEKKLDSQTPGQQ